MSKGVSCGKGRHIHKRLDAESRVTQCQKHSPDKSSWHKIDKEKALVEIAEKIIAIVDQYGPETIAAYCGNGVTFKALAMPAVHAFLNGLGSQQVYISLIIDQPAKIVSIGRHGIWAGDGHIFDSANVLMLIGNKVFVSGLHGPGSIPGWQPGEPKAARVRGLKLVVVDPCSTEAAKQPDLYLPTKPGPDAAILSGVINWILQNDLEEKSFCE